MNLKTHQSILLPKEISLCVVFIVVCAISHVSASGMYSNSYRSSYSGYQGAPASKVSKQIADDLREVDQLYSKCNGIDIRELTIMEVQHLFATHQLSSFALTNCYLDRIHHMNPYLHAVIQINPDAIRQAVEADLERSKNPQSENLMLGIPILLKDNVDTKDFMETTAGALAMLGIKPTKDADIVKALRKAGVVILGKTNLSEWANFRGTNIPSGWSGRGGQTVNPYNLNEDPAGSSSGSAVGVAANLAMVSIGTETDGSLIAPSTVQGICTIKPTLGNPSTKGVIPLSHSQDNVGPMARTIMDLAILLDVIRPLEVGGIKYSKQEHSFTAILQRNIFEKFRVGVPRYPYWDVTVINSTFLTSELPYLENLLGAMKSSPQFGVLDPVEYPRELIGQIRGDNEVIVLSHDFKHDLNEYLKKDVISLVVPRRIFSLSDIIKFNNEHPSPEGYNQELLIRSDATDGLQNRTYLLAKETNLRAAKTALDIMLVENKLDAVIWPSEIRSSGYFNPNLQDSPWNGYSVAAVAGYPSMNIPAGISTNGVPFGVTIVSLPGTEKRLLQIAHAIEQMFPRRSAPLFLV